MINNKIELTDIWSNKFKTGLEIGSKGVVVADFGASDKWDGLERDEDTPRYKVKFDCEVVNTCNGAYPFLFKRNELKKLI